jgi:hypothetical protein
MIQYAVPLGIFIPAGDYWIPAIAGMTAVVVGLVPCFSPERGRSYTRIGIST